MSKSDKSNRVSRDSENRVLEGGRNKYNMKYVSCLNVPDHIRKEGHEYFWERLSIRGQIDNALDNAMMRGWKPVPIDRDPGRFTDILERNPLSRKYVCQGDVMLMEREIELGTEERERNHNNSLDSLENSPAYNFNDREIKDRHNIGNLR